MAAIYLTEADVESLLNIQIAMDAVEEAFQNWRGNQIDNVPRRRARAPGIILHSMSAAAGYLDRVGWKHYTTTRNGARFLVGLYRGETGELEALIEADLLGQLRTGAATGVALKYLASPEATEAGLFGTGWQAESQLAALCAVRPVSRVRVYSRNAERRSTFARRMSDRLQAEVVAVEQPSEAVVGLPIVITATTSRTPVFDGRHAAAGATVCAMGSNALDRAEIDDVLVGRASQVVCDDVDACHDEAGELAMAVQAGCFDWSTAINLADVVSGRESGRAKGDDIVVFKSVGLAVEDVALASRLVELAREAGTGLLFPR